MRSKREASSCFISMAMRPEPIAGDGPEVRCLPGSARGAAKIEREEQIDVAHGTNADQEVDPILWVVHDFRPGGANLADKPLDNAHFVLGRQAHDVQHGVPFNDRGENVSFWHRPFGC